MAHLYFFPLSLCLLILAVNLYFVLTSILCPPPPFCPSSPLPLCLSVSFSSFSTPSTITSSYQWEGGPCNSLNCGTAHLQKVGHIMQFTSASIYRSDLRSAPIMHPQHKPGLSSLSTLSPGERITPTTQLLLPGIRPVFLDCLEGFFCV